jgi:hypothetical protein
MINNLGIPFDWPMDGQTGRATQPSLTPHGVSGHQGSSEEMRSQQGLRAYI